jgi:predicted phage-related endonuclease
MTKMYTPEEVIKDLDKFKIDALQRLLKLEMRVEELDTTDTHIEEDIIELKKALIKETDGLHAKVEYIQQEMPSSTTNKIMFAVFGATLSFLFAMILLYVR